MQNSPRGYTGRISGLGGWIAIVSAIVVAFLWGLAGRAHSDTLTTTTSSNTYGLSLAQPVSITPEVLPATVTTMTRTLDGFMAGPSPLTLGGNFWRQQPDGVLKPLTSVLIGSNFSFYYGIYSEVGGGPLQFSPEWYFTPVEFGVNTTNGVSYLFYGVGFGYSNFGISFGWDIGDIDRTMFVGVTTDFNFPTLTRGLDCVFGADKKFGVAW